MVHVHLGLLNRVVDWRQLAHQARRRRGCARRGSRSEFTFLFRSQGLIGIPARLAILTWQLSGFLEIQPRLSPLLRCQLGPIRHASLDACLFRRQHSWQSVGQLHPFLPARRVEAGPVLLKWFQCRPLRRRQIPPAQTLSCGRVGCRLRLARRCFHAIKGKSWSAAWRGDCCCRSRCCRHCC